MIGSPRESNKKDELIAKQENELRNRYEERDTLRREKNNDSGILQVGSLRNAPLKVQGDSYDQSSIILSSDEGCTKISRASFRV